MNGLAATLFVALVVEGLLEYLGRPIPKRYKPYAAALLGMTICLLFQINMFEWVGPAEWPHAGKLLTGLAAGRGSNYINDLGRRFR